MSNNPLASMSFESFVYRHAAFAAKTHFGLRHEGFRDSAEWRAAFDPYFIAREIDDVSDAIPGGLRLFETVETPKNLEKEEKQLFTELLAAAGHSERDLHYILNDDEFFEQLLATVPDFSRLSEFRKRQGFAKIPAALNWLFGAREEKKKILVFCYHKEVAEKFAFECAKKKIPAQCVHGSNSDALEREQMLYAAQREDDIVLIATIDAAREGVDLIEFDTTLFVEYDWRPWALEQAEGRTRRVGQKKPVRWVYMTFDRGVDQAMKKKVSAKARTIAKIKGVA
jgi:superfamily II DNA or RNA helicase